MSLVQSAIDRLKGREPAEPPGSQGGSQSPVTAAGVADAMYLQHAIQSVSWPSVAYPRVDLSAERLRLCGFLVSDLNIRKQREDYRNLRREVSVAMRATRRSTGQAVGPVVVVTSALPGDGKSYTALNLAISFASEESRDVLLIDGDIARASLTGAFQLEGMPGLVDLLRSPSADFRTFTAPTSIDRLRVMPAGRHDQGTADLMSAERLGMLFGVLRSVLAGHAVIIDTSPILALSESQSFIDVAGQVLLVVRAGVTPLDSVRDAASRIAEELPIGVVLNAWEPIYPSERKAYQLYGDYGGSRSQTPDR